MTPTMHIQAAGMCCAVGHSTPSASAAIGACLDHFQHSWFEARDGSPISCAMIHGLDVWGPERMGALFHSVLDECREQLDFSPARACLLLLVPDPARPGAEPDWPQTIYEHCTKEVAFHESSRICPWDRAGPGPALLHARALLQAGTVERVVMVGVDSLINAVTINALLDAELVRTAGKADGIIPGEGAGAVVLGMGDGAGVCVRGVGVGQEHAHLMQNILPNRAQGLTTAVRAAVAESGRPLTDIQFQMADSNGLDYYAEERAVMLMRTLEHRVPKLPIILPTSYFGETGAATGPLMLAYLTRFMPRTASGYGLVHCGADYGQRTAMLLEYHG